MDETITKLQQALDVTNGLVDNVTPDQLGASTPCTEYDVREVLNHLIGGNRNTVARVSGSPLVDLDTDFVGKDYQSSFRSSGQALVEAFQADGVLDRTYEHPVFGTPDGRFLARVRTFETLAHGWDIATATGQPTDIAPDLCESTLAGLRPFFANAPRTGNPFGPEQPVSDDAPAADKMAAFLGRPVM